MNNTLLLLLYVRCEVDIIKRDLFKYGNISIKKIRSDSAHEAEEFRLFTLRWLKILNPKGNSITYLGCGPISGFNSWILICDSCPSQL